MTGGSTHIRYLFGDRPAGHMCVQATMNCEENVILAEHTTMKVGGPARYFFTAKDTDDIKEAVLFARRKNLPVFILGGGSNAVFRDQGFNGVVIAIKNKGIFFENISGGKTRMIANAGEDWDFVVRRTVENNLYGLENLSLIPGTVGGAAVQNIGAYGKEARGSIEWVEVFDMNTMQTRILQNKECEFGYRQSIFKTEKGKDLIVAKVAFLLEPDGDLFLGYKDIKHFFESGNVSSPTLKQVRDAIITIRKNKLPDIKKFGTSGSFFKNPIVCPEKAKELKNKYPDMPHTFCEDGNVKISAAFLIDYIGGFKGARDGNVGVYDKHSLVLVNFKNAKAEELLLLSENIKNEIKNKTEIVLEEEVIIV